MQSSSIRAGLGVPSAEKVRILLAVEFILYPYCVFYCILTHVLRSLIILSSIKCVLNVSLAIDCFSLAFCTPNALIVMDFVGNSLRGRVIV